jgi:hypothetical protein
MWSWSQGAQAAPLDITLIRGVVEMHAKAVQHPATGNRCAFIQQQTAKTCYPLGID